MSPAVWVLVVVALVFLHATLAAAAGGKERWAWGLLGPLGVIVAGFRALRAGDAQIQAPAPNLRSNAGPEELPCLKCGVRQILFRDPYGISISRCPSCGATRNGYRTTQDLK